MKKTLTDNHLEIPQLLKQFEGMNYIFVGKQGEEAVSGSMGDTDNLTGTLIAACLFDPNEESAALVTNTVLNTVMTLLLKDNDLRLDFLTKIKTELAARKEKANANKN